jgi:hypothetical protein
VRPADTTGLSHHAPAPQSGEGSAHSGQDRAIPDLPQQAPHANCQPQTQAASAADDSREPGTSTVCGYPGGDAQKESGGQRAHQKAQTLQPREEVSSNPPNLLDGHLQLAGLVGGDHERGGKALAGKSTLNRLELTPPDATADSRYQKIVARPEAIEFCATPLAAKTASPH